MNYKDVMHRLMRKKTVKLISSTTFLLTLCLSSLMGTNNYAQQTKLNVQVIDESLDVVLKQIEKQSEYLFFYNTAEVNKKESITLKKEDATIYDVMDEVGRQADITYTIRDRHVVLSKSQTEKQTTTNNQQDERKVTGTIKDSKGQPVIGATVVVKSNPSMGTVTDIDGNFSIEIPQDAVLIVSYIGFANVEIATAGKSTFNVVLKEDAEMLDELVVVGYGVQKKENLTGAVSQVKMEEVMGDRPVTSVASALQGSIPGLAITGTMSPGEALSFNIRGTTSINGGSPLILVDGVESQINMVNPEDIESVSVLKDAASSAIYGARAAFGVILITTKKAKAGTKMQINYNNNFAFSTAINRPQQASVLQILETHRDFDNDGKYFAQSQDYTQWIDYVKIYNEDPNKLLEMYPGSYLVDGAFVPHGESVYYWLSDNDPQGEILDNYGFQEKHNVSAMGGSENINYRLSLGNLSNDGPLILDKDSYERINVQSYVSGIITDWLKTDLTMSYARSDRSVIDATDGTIYNTYFRAFYPTTDIPHSNDLDGEKVPAGSPANYIRYNEPQRTRNENTKIFSRTSITPIKGLEGIVEYAYEERGSDYKYYTNNWEYRTDQLAVNNRSNTPIYYNNKSSRRYNSLNTYATYQFKTNDNNHNFKIMAGFAQEQTYYEALNVNRKEMINPNMPSINGGVGEILATDSFTDFAIRSGYYRFNYNYKNKYLLEANGRYDGSSRFPTDTRFGFFPSVSAGWQVGRESFMAWSESWLDQFKLRGSWGQIGNQSIANYLYTPSMGTSLANWIVDGARPTTLGVPAMVRQNFTWEVVETIDLGFDLNMLNNRLTTIFSWYQRDTKGMLAPGMEFPAVVGASAPTQNTADLRTRGWELSLLWKDNIGDDWRYSVGANIYDATSEITKFNNEAGLLFDTNGNAINYEGRQIGEIWGYETDGFYTIDDFVSSTETVKGWEDGVWNIKEGVTKIRGNNNIRPGDLKFVNLRDDANSTNEIYAGEGTLENPGDQKIIGNNTPRYRFGFNTNIGWKNFDLSMIFAGTAKRDVWLSGNLIFPLSNGTFGTVFSNQLDYWKPVDMANGDYTAQNPDAYYPRIYNEANAAGSNYRTQTKYLSSGAYLRMKNISLSYRLPKSLISKAGFSNAKVFFSGENLLTFDSLPEGYDPERLSWGYPFYAVYSFGVNITL